MMRAILKALAPAPVKQRRHLEGGRALVAGAVPVRRRQRGDEALQRAGVTGSDKL